MSGPPESCNKRSINRLFNLKRQDPSPYDGFISPQRSIDKVNMSYKVAPIQMNQTMAEISMTNLRAAVAQPRAMDLPTQIETNMHAAESYIDDDITPSTIGKMSLFSPQTHGPKYSNKMKANQLHHSIAQTTELYPVLAKADGSDSFNQGNITPNMGMNNNQLGDYLNKAQRK